MLPAEHENFKDNAERDGKVPSMRTFVGLLTILAAAAVGGLTISAVISAGGIDILTVVSALIVCLLFVAGFGALKND